MFTRKSVILIEKTDVKIVSTPIKTFPNTRSHWPEGYGQLTDLGMKQHHDLGEKFRKKYVEQHKLVDRTYNGSQVYVRSTSKERTLMSAQVKTESTYCLFVFFSYLLSW